MMFCDFHPLPDKPGRFLCPRCKIPSSRHHRFDSKGPPPRHCPEPPEPPYEAVNAEWILTEFCPDCDRYADGRCKPDPDAPTKCGKAGQDIATMLARGVCCPKGFW
jgi:hypothetical protein